MSETREELDYMDLIANREHIDRFITDKENNIEIRQILVYNNKNFIYDRVQRKTEFWKNIVMQ